ncbi:MAG: 30S ribosomal protein S19 [Candidatus Aenigmarchaeota archaeon]|nr:30S ribosomal protein S19 [Candidatus Aenigmarchaeota archaeon]
MAKVLTFKGKSLEELQAMSLEEFSKMIPSRQRRSLVRGLTDKQKRFLERLRAAKKPLKTHCREMVIIPEMIGKKILIHGGKEWVSIELRQEMLGHRLGEFAPTNKKVMHSAPGIGATKSSKFLPLK